MRTVLWGTPSASLNDSLETMRITLTALFFVLLSCVSHLSCYIFFNYLH